MPNQIVRVNPVIRLLGVILLCLFVFGAYLAAVEGDMEILLTSLFAFCFFAPPIVIGKYPGRWLFMPDEIVNELNREALEVGEQEDRKGFVIAFVVSFLVSASTILMTALDI